MGPVESLPIPSSGLDLVNIRTQLARYFNLDEIQTLCFDIGIQYDNLAGDTLNGKARELVKYCYRHDLLPDLIRQCQSIHAGVQWMKSVDRYELNPLPEEWDDPLQQIYVLVKAFNRNRQQPFSDARTEQGDEIAFQMREAAPILFGKLDLPMWLRGNNIGKRLVAIKYLDWLQDIDYVGELIDRLSNERPFLQLHTLVTLHGMIDQMDDVLRAKLQIRMLSFNIVRNDPSLTFWKQRILSVLS